MSRNITVNVDNMLVEDVLYHSGATVIINDGTYSAMMSAGRFISDVTDNGASGGASAPPVPWGREKTRNEEGGVYLSGFHIDSSAPTDLPGLGAYWFVYDPPVAADDMWSPLTDSTLFVCENDRFVCKRDGLYELRPNLFVTLTATPDGDPIPDGYTVKFWTAFLGTEEGYTDLVQANNLARQVIQTLYWEIPAATPISTHFSLPGSTNSDDERLHYIVPIQADTAIIPIMEFSIPAGLGLTVGFQYDVRPLVLY